MAMCWSKTPPCCKCASNSVSTMWTWDRTSDAMCLISRIPAGERQRTWQQSSPMSSTEHHGIDADPSVSCHLAHLWGNKRRRAVLVELIVAVRFEPAQSQLCGRVRKCPYRATHSAGQITEDYH